MHGLGMRGGLWKSGKWRGGGSGFRTSKRRHKIMEAGMWRKMRKKWLPPAVDEADLAAAVAEAQRRQPPPVLWLLGKTQAGKTALIHALTGSSKAEIGNGFAPCTRYSQFYDFPQEAPLVRFLDTRGLGEVDYDPAEDIRYCEAQEHLVMAVIKAADPNQAVIFDVLREVRRRHPDWPIVVVQTGLHQLYHAWDGHPRPYPCNSTEAQAHLPSDITAPLMQQRHRLGELPGSGRELWVRWILPALKTASSLSCMVWTRCGRRLIRRPAGRWKPVCALIPRFAIAMLGRRTPISWVTQPPRPVWGPSRGRIWR